MPTRRYLSETRDRGAEATRRAILKTTLRLFSKRGIDRVTVAEIAERAGVGVSTVYALFESKEGILRVLMADALFGPPYRAVLATLDGVHDPVAQVLKTATIARVIWQAEAAELGLLRGASAFAPSLRAIEEEFERRRFELQRARLVALRKAGRMAPGLSLADARRILWALTNRETYRGLVERGGWTPAKYERWLSRTIAAQLIAPAAASA